MSSIQERLQLKRIPLDTWNVREQLCLASAVVRSGDQNWMSVSRALKTVGEPNRPADWYSQKSCAAQYGALLEHVETPKRKKRSSEGAVETPQESILKKLTQERVAEIQESVAEMNRQYEQLKNEINEVRNPATSEDRVRELWTAVETAKRARERETAKRAAWLKEREERRARAERTWRPPAQNNQTPTTPPPPSSPLLTSLLKSSPVVTTPQHIPHPATVVETISPSAGAPTLSMLLEKPGSTSPHDNKHAAIEHIKSQLVQIEQQLKASSTVPSPAPLPPPPPAVDIDDIEIKAEDVYAFRDIDLHIPPVATMHKGPLRAVEKPTFKKDEEETSAAEEIKVESEPGPVEIQPMEVEKVVEEIPVEEITVTEEVVPEVTQPEGVEPQPAEIKVAFPTPEIKVIQPEDQKPKEEVKEPEVPPPEIKPEVVEEVVPEVVEEVATEVVEETIVPPSPSPPPEPEEAPPLPPLPPLPPPDEPEEEVIAPEVTDLDSIPLPSDPPPEESVIDLPLQQPPLPPLPPKPQAEETIENIAEEVHAPEVTEEVPKEESGDKEDDAEATMASAPSPVPQDSIPLKEMMKEEVGEVEEAGEAKEAKEEGEPLEPHGDTDDDTPMEVRMLSREEEKDGKKKRDYSRKKKSDSRTCSGSESAAEASAPDSPHNDAERQHRLWKRSVMLVYSRLCAHKYASLFLRPITDEEAPGYSVVIKRPMDLTSIKRNIEAGNIRTTAEFQRDILLMLSNALMYNSSEHSVYQMAKELHEEAVSQLGMLLAAQAHAGLAQAPPRRKRRRAREPHPPHEPRREPHKRAHH